MTKHSRGMGEPLSLNGHASGRFPLRRRLGVQQALEWAFGREKAQLDLDVIDPENNRGAAVSLEWIIAQRAILGCSIDGSTGGGWGGSAPHHDAEVIAAIVANLPQPLGGRRMATTIAAHAAAGTTPNWMADELPKFAPAEVATNRHGTFAATGDSAKLGSLGWPAVRRKNRRGGAVVEPVLFCPVIMTPSPQQIRAARDNYLDWWGVLLHLADDLKTCGMLSVIELTSAMPPMTPWRKTRMTNIDRFKSVVASAIRAVPGGKLNAEDLRGLMKRAATLGLTEDEAMAAIDRADTVGIATRGAQG